jgi:hypothetical protein
MSGSSQNINPNQQIACQYGIQLIFSQIEFSAGSERKICRHSIGGRPATKEPPVVAARSGAVVKSINMINDLIDWE